MTPQQALYSTTVAGHVTGIAVAAATGQWLAGAIVLAGTGSRLVVHRRCRDDAR